jgi:hypothetical protein
VLLDQTVSSKVVPVMACQDLGSTLPSFVLDKTCISASSRKFDDFLSVPASFFKRKGPRKHRRRNHNTLVQCDPLSMWTLEIRQISSDGVPESDSPFTIHVCVEKRVHPTATMIH